MPFAVVGLRLRVLLSALALTVLVLLVQPAGAVSTNLVVSQVYGGGGNSGAHVHERLHRALQPRHIVGRPRRVLAPVRERDGDGELRCQRGPAHGASLDHARVRPVRPRPRGVGRDERRRASGCGRDGRDSDQHGGRRRARSRSSRTTRASAATAVPTPCDAAALARIVDLVGYGNANFFEGPAAAPTLVERRPRRCGATAAALTPTTTRPTSPPRRRRRGTRRRRPLPASATRHRPCRPRHLRTARPVWRSTRTSRSGSRENVNVTGSWFSISCASSGAHTGRRQRRSVRVHDRSPSVDLADGESLHADHLRRRGVPTKTRRPAGLAGRRLLLRSPPPSAVTIAEVQGDAHLSPLTASSHRRGRHRDRAAHRRRMRGVDPGSESRCQPRHFGRGVCLSQRRPRRPDRRSGAGQRDRHASSGRQRPDNLTITQIISTNATCRSSRAAMRCPRRRCSARAAARRRPRTSTTTAPATSRSAGRSTRATTPSTSTRASRGCSSRSTTAPWSTPTRSFGEITLLPDGGNWATGLRTSRRDPPRWVRPSGPQRITVDDEVLRDLAPVPRPVKSMPDLNVGDA